MKLLLPLLLLLAIGVGAPAQSKPVKKTQASVKKKTPARKAAPKVAPRRIDYTGEQVNFGAWKAVAAFADDVALRHGFPRAELEALFAQVRLVDSAVQLVKPAPAGKPKNITAVRALLIEPARISAGLAFWRQHGAQLARAEQEFGVPAEIIVGILGIETIYGRDTGRFRVLDVLTTLAFAYPEAPNQAARMAFFRGELENTLLLARKNGVDPFSLLGSFAGAIGMPQFMPGSVLAYGVDYDGDGRIDLHGSAADAIGSVAHFLVRHGWQRELGGPLVYRARVAADQRWQRFIGQGLAAKFTLADLLASGVISAPPPPGERQYGLIDLQNGAETTEYWLATDNFFAITHYNRSYYYAMSVLELGRAIALARRETL
jgi:membrane-bound lytic murein transglycosylase B